jgi:hypothetical protein
MLVINTTSVAVNATGPATQSNPHGGHRRMESKPQCIDGLNITTPVSLPSILPKPEPSWCQAAAPVAGQLQRTTQSVPRRKCFAEPHTVLLVRTVALSQGNPVL